MPIQAQVEGLGTLEFPDGTDPSVIQSTVKKQLGLASGTPATPESQAAKPRGPLEDPRRPKSVNLEQAGGLIKSGVGGLLEAGAEMTGETPEQARARSEKLGLAPKTSGQQVANVAGSLLAAGPSVEAKAATTIAGIAQKAEQTAKEYVSRFGINWDRLSEGFKSTLSDIARDSKRLEKLDPEAIKRKARLDELNIPASRGQVTRDLSQLTREENITKTEAGAPIRDINAEQDRVLHQHLDTLRKETGGVAETPQGVGKSVQGALREKLRATKANASKAYELANQLGEGEITQTKPLEEFLKRPINEANVGWVASRLEKLRNPDGSITLKNLEDIRQELTQAAKSPDKGGHYAGEAVKVIDQIMDSSGSEAYKNARTAWKGMKDEFDKQGRVKKLVSEKGMSVDRATALEDTFDVVVRKGSAEDLQRVKKSLTTGTEPKIVRQGQQAWKDLQAATIDYLKEKAAGKRAIPGEKSQLQFNSSFIDAVYELDKDGKLDVLFGKGTSATLRKLAEATRDVRTKPTGRIAGSDTGPKLLNFLEKLSAIPGGKYIAGTAKAVKKVGEMGQETREAARAKTSPFEEEAKKARKGKGNTVQGLRLVAPTAATLQDYEQ